MIHYGLIQSDKFPDLIDMPEVFAGAWQSIQVGGIDYMTIKSFEHYFTSEVTTQLDAVFASELDFNAFLGNNGIVTKYFNNDGFVSYSERSFTGTLEDIQLFAEAKGWK